MATTSKALPLLIGVGGLCIGVLFLFIGWRIWGSSRELAKSGVRADATVLKKFRKEEGATWGGLENYFVTLAFTNASGQKFETELKLASKVWRKLDEGGSFAVSYLPAKPEAVFQGPPFAHKFRCGVAVVLMAFGLVAVIVFPVGGIKELIQAR